MGAWPCDHHHQFQHHHHHHHHTKHHSPAAIVSEIQGKCLAPYYSLLFSLNLTFVFVAYRSALHVPAMSVSSVRFWWVFASLLCKHGGIWDWKRFRLRVVTDYYRDQIDSWVIGIMYTILPCMVTDALLFTYNCVDTDPEGWMPSNGFRLVAFNTYKEKNVSLTKEFAVLFSCTPKCCYFLFVILTTVAPLVCNFIIGYDTLLRNIEKFRHLSIREGVFSGLPESEKSQ